MSEHVRIQPLLGAGVTGSASRGTNPQRQSSNLSTRTPLPGPIEDIRRKLAPTNFGSGDSSGSPSFVDIVDFNESLQDPTPQPSERIRSPLVFPGKELLEVEVPAGSPPSSLGDKVRAFMNDKFAQQLALELHYKAREKVRGQSFEAETVEKAMPQFVDWINRIIVTNQWYSDRIITVRTNVKQKAGLVSRIVGGFAKIFGGGNKAEGVADAAGGFEKLVNEPDANKSVNSSQDALRELLNKLEVFSLNFSRNWRTDYAIDTRHEKKAQLVRTADELCSIIEEMIDVGYDLDVYDANNGNWFGQGSRYARSFLPSDLPRLPGQNSSGYGSSRLGAIDPYNVPLPVLLVATESLYRSQRSRTNEGKFEAIELAEAVYFRINFLTARLDRLGPNASWHNDVRPVVPITKQKNR